MKYKPNLVRIQNKLCGLLLMILGFILAATTGEATFFVLSMVFGVFLFRSREKIIG